MEIIKCFEIEASFSLQSIEFKIEDYLHIKDRLSQGDNFRTIVKNNWRIAYTLFQSLSKLVWKKCWNHRELKASLTESSIHSKKAVAQRDESRSISRHEAIRVNSHPPRFNCLPINECSMVACIHGRQFARENGILITYVYASDL